MFLGRIRREPFFQFLLGGLALFVLHHAVAPDPGSQPGQIVIPATRVAALATAFERTWLRPPSEDELGALVQDYVDEEILYREALELGLDRDDLVVRRRLRQKMEFLHLDISANEAPSEEELAAFLEAHPERFRVAKRLSFEQVFLAPRDADVGQRDADALLVRLRAGEPPGSLGDTTLLPPAMERVTPGEIESTFGSAFAKAIASHDVGAWRGPIPSSYGTHLVRITETWPARQPTLAERRSEVDRELQAEGRALREREFLDTLRSRYEVRIEEPAGAAPPAGQPR